MKQFIFLILIACSLNVNAQIKYSSEIPFQELSVLKKLEKTLKKTAFTLSKVISDTSYSKKDSLFYSKIMNQFVDTASVRLLLDKEEPYFEKVINSTNAMTKMSITGIHNMLHCLPDSLFFVMPATEYVSTSDEFELDSLAKKLFVAGYASGKYLYPIYTIKFTERRNKLCYINMIFRQDSYPKEKQDWYTEKLEAIISPCTRTFSEDYIKRPHDPLQTLKIDTTR